MASFLTCHRKMIIISPFIEIKQVSRKFKREEYSVCAQTIYLSSITFLFINHLFGTYTMNLQRRLFKNRCLHIRARLKD